MGFNLLKGKRGIIFGALNSSSIAWKTAAVLKMSPLIPLKK